MPATNTQSVVVSSEQEQLIRVNAQDEVIGSATKKDCHDGAGLLHRAFSIFVFNPGGQLLLQQRAQNKRLWPEHWSNSCCSHPRWGELTQDAAHRRLDQELGLSTSLTFLYQFEYQARFADQGSENELCSVFVGTSTDEPKVNREEIADWRWVEPSNLTTQLAASPDQFTPWLQLEWQRLTNEFAGALPPNR